MAEEGLETKIYQLTVGPNRSTAITFHGQKQVLMVIYPGKTEYSSFSEQIENFDPIVGHQYVIEIEDKERQGPPRTCGSNRQYTLIKIISDQVV